MRELKFRAWNKVAGRYSKPFTLNCDVLNYTDDDGLGVIKSLTDELVEQFTGLKDKNGVDIYEGDIVEVKGTKRHSYYITDVLFKGQSFTLRVNKTYLNDDSCLKTGVYVIGNIHENKDLVCVN
tara:strand:+ start:41 stop:412 length:372 start_codon:yes stop_codon:yes gene_type:complete